MRELHARGSQLPRRRAALLVVALLGLLAAVAQAGAQELGLEDPAARLRRTALENGLTVLTLEDHSTQVVSFQMWVRVGSRDESRYSGLAHLFEHMMFRGSKHIGPEEHARLIEARGGQVNAFTTDDATVYFDDVTSESLPLVIDLEAERLHNLDISEATLEQEREVVLEERSLRTEDSPDGRAFEALTSIAWVAHPYRRPVIGWRSDVEKATVEVCRRFFDTFYAPNNLVLVVVGDFETEPTLARIERTFGRLAPSAEVPRNPTEEPPQLGERRAVIHFDVRSPILAAAWHAPPAGHEDSDALEVLTQILSAGRSSRLYRKLVYEEQKALYAQGAYWDLEDAGLFYAWAGVRPGESVEEVEALFFGEVERIGRDGVSEEEVEKARRQIEVDLVNGLGTAHALGMRIGWDTVFFDRVRPLAERLEAIRAVGPDDVQRVVRTYLRPELRSVVHVVPPPPDAPEAG